jgi:hypothetical protein
LPFKWFERACKCDLNGSPLKQACDVFYPHQQQEEEEQDRAVGKVVVEGLPRRVIVALRCSQCNKVVEAQSSTKESAEELAQAKMNRHRHIEEIKAEVLRLDPNFFDDV